MSNTVMEDALELIYAENEVPRLLSGKAVYRAIKGHQRVGTVLHTISLEDIVRSTDIDSDSIKQQFQEAIKRNLDLNSITSSEVLKMLICGHNISTLMTYFDNIEGLRLGNWKLHLDALSKILPSFAAYGHNNSTVSNLCGCICNK